MKEILVIKENTIFDYGVAGAIGIPKEIAKQFGFSVGEKAEWYVVRVGGARLLGLRPVTSEVANAD